MRNITLCLAMGIFAVAGCASPVEDDGAGEVSQKLACIDGPPGPTAAMVAQIRPFDVTPDLIDAVCKLSSFGPNCNVDQLTQVALVLGELASSANNILPPTPFDDPDAADFLATKEYRGYLKSSVFAQCNKDGVLIDDPAATIDSSNGYTPVRTGPFTYYAPGSGNIYTHLTGGKGQSSATLEIQHNFRIEEGLGLGGQLGLPGSIVPWVWQNMKWQLSCGRDSYGRPQVNETVTMTGSHFPSHFAYAGTTSLGLVGYAAQSNLPGFLFGPAIANPGKLNASYGGVLKSPCPVTNFNDL